MSEVKRRLQIFFLIFIGITVLGTLGFMHFESLSFTDAFYFNIVTMSTVGYGDIHPTVTASRLLSIFLIVLGGGSFLGVIANGTELILLRREARNRMRKINMVLGIFFSETGYRLLTIFSRCDTEMKTIRQHLMVSTKWTGEHFIAAQRQLKRHKFNLDISDLVEFKDLRDFLTSRRRALISLLENPAIIEDEGFSEVLLAVFHLTDELECRENFRELPPSDVRHLAMDMSRAYRLMLEQWLYYLQHLKVHYPYIFSLAIRKNPFDPHAKAVINL
ncbi:Ion channel [Desulfocicer vacuolatum DSM 3385]|uniref:Ion channel n=1 Tax=Desulfocicer vacuolatum DSM 3385 TaxID=1121400 RepID=A0A1W2DG44_9BACT|nr:potassium channel family protein [Desulfocicer vacuolatum]SMC96497.1 Ion channel [Desulfocicer vacuolatum DSM 3385]